MPERYQNWPRLLITDENKALVIWYVIGEDESTAEIWGRWLK